MKDSWIVPFVVTGIVFLAAPLSGVFLREMIDLDKAGPVAYAVYLILRCMLWCFAAVGVVLIVVALGAALVNLLSN